MTGSTWMAGVVLLAAGLSSVACEGPRDARDRADSRSAHANQDKSKTAKSQSNPGKPGKPSSTDRPAKPAAQSDPKGPRQRTHLVTRVVDGDTIELGNGETVRLVGMDTPEVGECGFERASANLGRLVLGQQVRLGTIDEDRDRYGRLLRYVDVGTQDAGLRLIKNGLAIARYDSRDGYGFHPREPRYIAADKAAKHLPCTSPAKPQPLIGGGRNCATGYTPCIPSYPPDLDCPDVNGPLLVTGSDPHGLDADHDGRACE